MEKIQAAIAKARATRDKTGQITPPAAAPVTEVAAARAPAAQPSQTVSASEAALASDTAWLALSQVTPDPVQLQRSRVVAAEAGAEALPFDVIRTRMLQQMRANNWTRVAITSPDPGCGKSMVALNLAFSLARQPEQRTILLEADLRRPKLARYLGLSARHDVSRVLEGSAPFFDHALRLGENLAIATQTHSIRSPAELLQGAAVTDTLASIAEDYAPNVMLFDLPPMRAGDDVMAFIGHVDAVLIVAAADMTTIKQIDHCERDLATQCQVMGVVLNKCRYFDDMPHYDYGY